MKYHKNGREDAAATKLIVEQGAVCTLNLFRTQEGLTAADVIEGFDVSAYSFHSNYDRSNHVLRDTRIYYPSSRAGIEDMEKKALGYIEIHGLETYTLSEDVEIPVFDGTTPATVDMHATKLVVPAGKSVLVNGTLAVRELVIESGGSVTVNGYLDAVNGITLNNGGTLTVNNTHIDAGYVPTTDIEALKNIVYNGDADLLLHLVVWPSDNVSNAIRTASDAVDDHVNCMVELRTDWTVAEAFDAHLITLRVRKGSTLTVNNVLTVKDLVVDDGGKLVFGDGGSISYAAEKTEVEVGSFSQLQATISAFNQQREQDPSARIDAYTSGNFAITESITIPNGFQLRCGNNLTIAANAVVTVEGKLDAIEGGHVNILGTVINNNQFRMFDTGVMELSGTLVNNHSVYYKRVSTDRTHLVINSGATFTNNSDFAIADDIVRDPAVLGVDVNGYCVARMWDEPDMSRYCAPEVFDHFEGMCSSGKFVYLELHGIEEVSVAESMNIPENMSVEMGETNLVVPSGFTLTVNGKLTVKNLIVDDGGTVITGDNGSITYAAGTDIEALRAAIANPAISEYELRGNPFTITEDLTIPSDFTVIIGSGSSLVIPAGVDVNLKGRLVLCDGAVLDLAGSMRKGTLELDEGATVNLTGTCRLEPGKLRLDGEIAAMGGGMSEPKLMALNNGRPNGRITVTAGSRPAVRIDGLDEAKLSEWVKFNDNEGYFVLYYHAENDAEFSAMMEDMRTLPARFYGIQKLDYPAVIRGNVAFPGIEIRVAGYDGASLTIAEGAVLSAPTVMLQGAQMTVNGTFISIPRDEPDNNHNGALILTQNDGIDPMLTVTDTGIVGGTDCSIELPQGTTDPTRYVSGINPGQLKVVSDPYRPFKIYAVAPELHLPESLNKIESEAFAGGSFSSVHIPAGVSSIASDAFGDMTGLKVYGEYGTEAAQFASDHHFPFAPLVWRGNQ